MTLTNILRSIGATSYKLCQARTAIAPDPVHGHYGRSRPRALTDAQTVTDQTPKSPANILDSGL